MFSDVTPEPTVRDVKNAYNEYKRSGADFILAIGGGSPIDTAKAVFKQIIKDKAKVNNFFILKALKVSF